MSTTKVEVFDGTNWRDTLATRAEFFDGQQWTQIMELDAAGPVRQIWTGTEWWPIKAAPPAIIPRHGENLSVNAHDITWQERADDGSFAAAWNLARTPITTLANITAPPSLSASDADKAAGLALMVKEMQAWVAKDAPPLESIIFASGSNWFDVFSGDHHFEPGDGYEDNVANLMFFVLSQIALRRDAAGKWTIDSDDGAFNAKAVTNMEIKIRQEGNLSSYTVNL